MNEFVELVVEPSLMRNSLILIGLTFRTFSAVVSDCFLPFAGFVHETLPTRSPLKAAGPEVTLKVALTLAPGATGSTNVFDVWVVPATKEVHCLGTEMLNWTPAAGARLSRGTSYLAATTLTCTNWSVAFEGNVPAAVIAPS